ncbi:hypothetical protein B0O99DRAFT_691108 [Bisporella sp. PMI_857]|nr:hypothetical protein B0O99DRAFT_691108 [Bisporella sp. PMI_857]
MAEPLSLTASAIAVATLELQSTKINVYDTISGLFKASKVLFNDVESTVRMCITDLDPLAKKLGRGKAEKRENDGPKKVAGALSVYIKNSDFREIEGLLASKRPPILEEQIIALPSKPSSEQTALSIASNEDINDQVARINMNVQKSTTEARKQHTTYCNQAWSISDQHTRAVIARFINLEKTTATIQDPLRVTVESLQNSMTSQFIENRDDTQLLNSEIRGLLHELLFSGRSTREDILAEAQLIAEDLATILQALLDEINLPNLFEIIRKWKIGVIDNDEAAEVKVGIQQRRAFKQMRGLLESSRGA